MSHLGHEELAGVVEDLGVVGTLGQSVEPHADGGAGVSFGDVHLGQSVAKHTGLGTQLQQGLAQQDPVVKPVCACVCGTEPEEINDAQKNKTIIVL